MTRGNALERGATGFASDRSFRRCSPLLLGLAFLLSVFRVEGATIVSSTSSHFNFFGTVSGDNHIYLEPATFSIIGRLPTFDSSLGTLTGVKVYASFVGSYSILSHCTFPFCDFTTSGGFSDGFDSSPPGANYSADGYAMPIHLTPTSQGLGGSSASGTGNTNFSEQVAIDPAYFADYLDTAGDYVYFVKNGDTAPEAHIWHENLLDDAIPFLEACIDDCGDGVELISLAAWLATLNHSFLYNDTHFKFSGYRFFQIDYAYDPFASAIPAPGTLLLLAVGLGIIGLMRRRRG
jgi:hypothetical protein